ncbi:MAG: hypothetical protein HYY49_10770 [Ignavibacteriales bacterium]|nr:hypothetical protein [Ignavibacteriales bacterium]
MTSRERIQAAMDLREPDRVPVMCQLSIGHMLLQLGVSPVEFWFDATTFAEGLVSLRKKYDFDGILVSLHGHNPYWRNDVLRIQRTNDGEEVTWKNGEKWIHRFNELPQRLTEHHSGCSINALNTAHLPASLNYIPVSQGLHFRIDPSHAFDVFEIVRDKAGEDFSLHGEITSALDYYLDFLGHEEGLMGFIDEPEKAKSVLKHFTALLVGLAKEMCSKGVDAIKISSPFAGAGFISAEFYRSFVLPFERAIAEAVRGCGVHVYTHTCGAIADRLELMFDAGVTGIECLDPPPLGNVELEDAKQRTKRRGFIKGNVDSVNTLLFKTKPEIMNDARKRIQIGKQGGGYIFSTACSVAPYVESERLLLLREAVEKWG